MAVVETAEHPFQQQERDPQAVGTFGDISVGFGDPTVGSTVEVSADTFVCTGNTSQQTPAVDGEQVSVGYDTPGPLASTIAGEDVSVDLTDVRGGASLTSEVSVIPNGTAALPNPHLTATDVAQSAEPLTDWDELGIDVADQQPWDGYVGSSGGDLGTLVSEPGSTMPVGVDQRGSFTVNPSAGAVSTDGTRRIHLVEDALTQLEAPPWDPAQTIVRQDTHWVLETEQRVAQGAATTADIEALSHELDARLTLATAGTALSDEQKREVNDTTWTQVNTAVAISKSQMFAGPTAVGLLPSPTPPAPTPQDSKQDKEKEKAKKLGDKLKGEAEKLEDEAKDLEKKAAGERGSDRGKTLGEAGKKRQAARDKYKQAEDAYKKGGDKKSAREMRDGYEDADGNKRDGKLGNGQKAADDHRAAGDQYRRNGRLYDKEMRDSYRAAGDAGKANGQDWNERAREAEAEKDRSGAREAYGEAGRRYDQAGQDYTNGRGSQNEANGSFRSAGENHYRAGQQDAADAREAEARGDKPTANDAWGRAQEQYGNAERSYGQSGGQPNQLKDAQKEAKAGQLRTSR